MSSDDYRKDLANSFYEMYTKQIQLLENKK